MTNPTHLPILRYRQILTERKTPAFTMIAGAGSGKTTSLIKALASCDLVPGSRMLANRQQVACITYTEIARQEIEDELAEQPDRTRARPSTVFSGRSLHPFRRTSADGSASTVNWM